MWSLLLLEGSVVPALPALLLPSPSQPSLGCPRSRHEWILALGYSQSPFCSHPQPAQGKPDLGASPGNGRICLQATGKSFRLRAQSSLGNECSLVVLVLNIQWDYGQQINMLLHIQGWDAETLTHNFQECNRLPQSQTFRKFNQSQKRKKEKSCLVYTFSHETLSLLIPSPSLLFLGWKQYCKHSVHSTHWLQNTYHYFLDHSSEGKLT